MRKGSAAIDMGRNLFRFQGQEISMNSQVGGNHNPQVARVTVAKRLVIPPNSALQVRCKMNGSMSDYLIESIQTENKSWSKSSALCWDRPSGMHTQLLRPVQIVNKRQRSGQCYSSP